jgi:t-SNARE complex subunit (syntaxin)
MKFWKSLKSSGGIWTNLPTNEAAETKDNSTSKDNKLVTNQKHLEQSRKVNNSQLHRVSRAYQFKKTIIFVIWALIICLIRMLSNSFLFAGFL